MPGPLSHTVDDFWRMVWEYKLPTIVMLTQLEESGKVTLYTLFAHTVYSCIFFMHCTDNLLLLPTCIKITL